MRVRTGIPKRRRPRHLAYLTHLDESSVVVSAPGRKDELLSSRWSPLPGLWNAEPLAAKIDEVAAGSFKYREPPQIQAGG